MSYLAAVIRDVVSEALHDKLAHLPRVLHAEFDVGSAASGEYGIQLFFLKRSLLVADLLNESQEFLLLFASHP